MNWSATQGLPYLLFSAFLRARKLDMVYVPYAAVYRRHCRMSDKAAYRLMRRPYGTFVPLLEANQASIVMVLNGERAPQLPNVPTAKELGCPN